MKALLTKTAVVGGVAAALMAVSAPAAQADVTIKGLSGDECVVIVDPYVTVTPTVTFGAGEVIFYGASECM